MGKYTPTRTPKLPLFNKVFSSIPFELLSYAYYISQPRVIILEDIKSAYIPIPKIAHTSIKRTIAKTPKTDKVRIHQVPFNSEPLKRFNTNTYYTFSFVRNPLTRLISLYRRNVYEENPKHLFYRYGSTFYHKMSFTEFVEAVCKIPDWRSDKHFRSQHWFLMLNGKFICNYIGRFETLETDWNKLSEKTGLGTLDKFNSSSTTAPIEEYFNHKTLNKVLVRYKKDIELLGYKNEIELFKKKLSP